MSDDLDNDDKAVLWTIGGVLLFCFILGYAIGYSVGTLIH